MHGRSRQPRNRAKSTQRVVVTGATATGKSFLGAALAESACRHGVRAVFVCVQRLVEDLAVARASGSYSSALARLFRIDVLVLDDFLLAPMKHEPVKAFSTKLRARPPRRQHAKKRWRRRGPTAHARTESITPCVGRHPSRVATSSVARRRPQAF